MVALEPYFERLTFRAIDAGIEAVVRGEARLGACRTLDAPHLATAPYCSPHLYEPLCVSFDARMRAAALSDWQRLLWRGFAGWEELAR